MVSGWPRHTAPALVAPCWEVDEPFLQSYLEKLKQAEVQVEGFPLYMLFLWHKCMKSPPETVPCSLVRLLSAPGACSKVLQGSNSL